MTTEAKVGVFVLSCFAILAFTIIYLLNAQYSGGSVQYRTYLRYAGGLAPGASALYGGMLALPIVNGGSNSEGSLASTTCPEIRWQNRCKA